MDNNTYHLYVHIDGGEQKSVLSSQSGQSADASKDGTTASGAVRAVKKVVSIAAAAKFADTLISYDISQVSLQTGAQQYEQKLQFGYSMLKKGVGVVGATVAGARVGGIAGAVAGFVASTMYQVVGYFQRSETLQTEKRVEDIGIGLMSIRAGTSGSRGRTQ